MPLSKAKDRERKGEQFQPNSNLKPDRRTQHLAEVLIDPTKRAKLIQISRALDKTMTGLDGKPLNLGGLVRLGISGFTFSQIKELL